ncbi:MAG: hypothetical protein KDE01_13680 [Caldilineaceae bacterium]|nr:hypothetical protein [Caldilineaceae bacterium]
MEVAVVDCDRDAQHVHVHTALGKGGRQRAQICVLGGRQTVRRTDGKRRFVRQQRVVEGGQRGRAPIHHAGGEQLPGIGRQFLLQAGVTREDVRPVFNLTSATRARPEQFAAVAHEDQPLPRLYGPDGRHHIRTHAAQQRQHGHLVSHGGSTRLEPEHAARGGHAPQRRPRAHPRRLQRVGYPLPMRS